MSRRTKPVHCNKCGQRTQHSILASKRENLSTPYEAETLDATQFATEEEFRLYSAEESRRAGTTVCDIYEIVQCRGCEAFAFILSFQHYEGEPEIVARYPPAIARRAPEWIEIAVEPGYVYTTERKKSAADADTVPDVIRALMKEVYVAVQNDSPRLAAMGVRAALDVILVEAVGDIGNFDKKLDKFTDAGYIGVRQAVGLKAILDAGSAAAHRAWEPTKTDLETLLNNAESAIEQVYLHSHAAARLGERVPQRSAQLPGRKREQ